MIADKIKDLRKKSKYTQQQVADLLGIDRSTYCYYELGRITPDINTVMKLAEIFKIHYTQILDSEKSMRFSDSSFEKISFDVLNYDEKCLIMAFRTLSKERKEKILEEVFKSIKSENYDNKTK